MSAPRFEGSYLGDAGRISAAAVMECKICWTAYDPAEGDEHRQVPPGTPFAALPEDWSCPACGAPREQFMVLSDPGSAVAPAVVEADPAMTAAVGALVAAFREIHAAKMRDTPLSNRALSVEAVGFRRWEGRFLGVLVTPWFMNLTVLPAPGEDWSALRTGEKEELSFPCGRYEFIHAVREGVGGYKGCSLFSPMADFASQLQATDVARAVMAALFVPEKPAAEAAAAPAAPSRRAFLTGAAS